MAFERLRNYRDGEIWNRLLQVRPEHTFGPMEFEEWEMPPWTQTDFVYHYTTASGLQGILQSNRIWATAAYYLNDSSKIEYGCQLVRKELGVWRKANQGNRCFAADALQALDGVFSSPLSRMSRTTTIFVTCFCENGNLLSQWRAYGQAGGYSLGFPIDHAKVRLRIPGQFWDLQLAKVIYNKRVQSDKVNSILKQAFLAISDSSLDAVTEGQKENLILDSTLYIQEVLLDEIVAFKNPAFKEEREWRLIVRPRIVKTEEPQEGQEKKPGFRFRGSRGYLIPYLELHPEGEHLPLSSVRFGPSLEASRTEYSVRMLLSSCGFDKVEVAGSEIPVIL